MCKVGVWRAPLHKLLPVVGYLRGMQTARRASVIGNDIRSMSKRPYPTHNPFLPTTKELPHQELTINPHALMRIAQQHMIPLHDYITRNTETPVSQALLPITTSHKIRCPNTLKIHAITLTISSYKLLSETILIGLTETSVSILSLKPIWRRRQIEKVKLPRLLLHS